MEQGEGEEEASAQQRQLSPPPACVLCLLGLSRSNSEEFRGWDITEDKPSCLEKYSP